MRPVDVYTELYEKLKLKEKELEALRVKCERYEKALEFYADINNWVELGGMNHILKDEYISNNYYGKSGGKRAREALND